MTAASSAGTVQPAQVDVRWADPEMVTGGRCLPSGSGVRGSHGVTSPTAPDARPDDAAQAPSRRDAGADHSRRTESAQWPACSGPALAQRLERFGRRVLEHLNYRLEVSVLLCDGVAMRALNARYRDVDAPTDVLSFAQLDDGWPTPRPEAKPPPAGDIVIAVDVAVRQADCRGEPVERELCRRLVHGMLHLVGMDHADPPREHEPMLTLQERTLRELFAGAAASTP